MMLQTLIPTLAQATEEIGFSSNDFEGSGIMMPVQASTVANEIDWMYMAIYWLSVFFFVGIVGVMTYFVIKYRRRSEDEKAQSDLTHHTGLELTWTIIPLLLSVAIFYVGLQGYVKLRQTPPDAYQVNVIGQKWNWTFEHRNGASEVGRLKVPAGRPVELVMMSSDVLHSFYIPAFRVKQDVVPGRYTTLWFEATQPGIYQALCTEYCGTQHSQMGAIIEVLEPAEFERQIAEDAAWLDKVDESVPGALADAGARLFARCASCHSLDGSRLTGPSFWETHDLIKDGGERQLADGTSVSVDMNYIRESILNPSAKIVAGYQNAMPSFQGQLNEKAIRALGAFLTELDTQYTRDGQPNG